MCIRDSPYGPAPGVIDALQIADEGIDGGIGIPMEAAFVYAKAGTVGLAPEIADP